MKKSMIKETKNNYLCNVSVNETGVKLLCLETITRHTEIQFSKKDSEEFRKLTDDDGSVYEAAENFINNKLLIGDKYFDYKPEALQENELKPEIVKE